MGHNEGAMLKAMIVVANSMACPIIADDNKKQ